MNKTVVELDLVGYSTICANFEQGLDVNSVAQLNRQIQSFVDEGLTAVDAVRHEHVMQTTGDGAIVVFDSASEAHSFAQAVNDATRAHNRERQQHLAKRVFRMGAASGDIIMEDKSGGGFEIAGMTIARAVRLEAKALPGGILVDEPTFKALSEEQTQRYASKEIVAGKRDEEFEAYACQLNPDGPKDAAYFSSRKDTPTSQPSSVPVKPRTGPIKADISRIIDYAPAELIGREDETKLLNEAWEKAVRGETNRPHVLTLVALGGEGKTSLVAKWVADLSFQGWPECEAAFAWSFYSQGTSDKTQASSDSFLKEALLFFGDTEMANSASGSFDKGRRLAQLIGERKALLILDGLEPLQYAPTSPTGSELKDQGVSALLKALATNNNGLCVVTTRYSVPDLRNFWQTTATETKLTSLSNEAGVALLRKLGVKGTQKEFERLVGDVKGHALTLNLLGSYLRDAHGGDIRKRDLVRLEEADAEEQSGHAFHVMDAYVRSFKDEGEKGRRALSILRLLGLFDRPATADCLNALWTGEEIGGLTGPLIGISEALRNVTLKRLENAQLITVNREKGSEELVSLDAHPLIREYFATRVRTGLPGAWRAAHRRLYEYLRDTTKEGDQPTLEDLQPLYQAVAHGCQAGLQQETCNEVYKPRVLRVPEFWSSKKLGAFGSDLGAIACFFEQPWSRVSPVLTEGDQAWVLGQTAFRLRALGRLAEALEPLRATVKLMKRFEHWQNSAIAASNLSELELTLGEVAGAVRDAEQSVTYADRSGDAFQRMGKRTTHADALHQAGCRAEAETRFREAEQMQAESQPYYPLLYTLQGFRYCDLILATPEHAAWQIVLECGDLSPLLGGQTSQANAESGDESPHSTALSAVNQRAAQTLKWTQQAREASLLDIALDHLTLGRAALYAAILASSDFQLLTHDPFHVDTAVDGLRRSGNMDDLPRGLLTRAWLRFLTDARTGSGSAQEDLDEAWEIAERGPMRLFMADIHLDRARLFHDVKPYPWDRFPDGSEGRGPKDDLTDARKLIEKCGYWRRKEELEDAEEAAKNW
jgi:class 3 adenylate cyclase